MCLLFFLYTKFAHKIIICSFTSLLSIVLFQKNTQSHSSSQVFSFYPSSLPTFNWANNTKCNPVLFPIFFSQLSSLLLQMHYLCFSFTAEYYILPTTIPNQKQQRERTSTSSTLLLPTLHLHTSIKHPHIHKYIDSPIQTQFISYITGFL